MIVLSLYFIQQASQSKHDTLDLLADYELGLCRGSVANKALESRWEEAREVLNGVLEGGAHKAANVDWSRAPNVTAELWARVLLARCTFLQVGR